MRSFTEDSGLHGIMSALRKAEHEALVQLRSCTDTDIETPSDVTDMWNGISHAISAAINAVNMSVFVQRDIERERTPQTPGGIDGTAS